MLIFSVGNANRGVGKGRKGKGNSGGSKKEAVKTGNAGASACLVKDGMGNPKPPVRGPGGRTPAPLETLVGGQSLDDAVLILDEYGDIVALRRPVLELAKRSCPTPALPLKWPRKQGFCDTVQNLDIE